MKGNSGELAAAGAALVMGLTLNADAAVGAAFGAVFFMLSNECMPMVRRLVYSLVSGVIGYSVGIAAGAPWSMLAAATGAAIAVVTLGALVDVISKQGISGLMEIWRGRK